MYKIIGESKNEYEMRKSFYDKLKERKIDDKEAMKMSVIWSNIKFRQCRYPSWIYHLISKYDETISN